METASREKWMSDRNAQFATTLKEYKDEIGKKFVDEVTKSVGADILVLQTHNLSLEQEKNHEIDIPNARIERLRLEREAEVERRRKVEAATLSLFAMKQDDDAERREKDERREEESREQEKEMKEKWGFGEVALAKGRGLGRGDVREGVVLCDQVAKEGQQEECRT